MEMAYIKSTYFVMHALPPSYASALVSFGNIELLDDLHKQKKNVVLLLPHFDNWTYLSALPYFTKYRVFSAYSNIKSYVRRKLIGLRSRHGSVMIHRSKLYKTVLQSDPREPSLYMILPDQLPVPPYKRSVTFFNKKLYIQSGAERIIKHLDAVTLFLDIKKVSAYRYRYDLVLFNQYPGDHEHVLDNFYKELERKITGQPELWFRWFTAHPAFLSEE